MWGAGSRARAACENPVRAGAGPIPATECRSVVSSVVCSVAGAANASVGLAVDAARAVPQTHLERRKTRLHWGCKMTDAAVSGRGALVARGQVVSRRNPARLQAFPWPRGRADAAVETVEPFVTSEVLYQLSYVGVRRDFPDSLCSRHAPGLQELWSDTARGKGSRPSPARMCSETIPRARPPVCVLGRGSAPGAMRWARRRVFGLVTG